MESKKITLKILVVLILAVLGVKNVQAQSKTSNVAHFNKVIVSPHIQVVFRQGDEESVHIETTNVSYDKINIEVHGKTLRLYLDDAKMVTKSEKVKNDKWKSKQSIYKGTQVSAVVTYKNLKELSLRGEETFVCESPITIEKFRLKIYGESQVYLNEVTLQTLHTTIYGKSYLEIKVGTITHQRFTAYGEGKINALGVDNTTTKITSYGEGNFRLNISETLKVTAYGEAIVAYEGNPAVHKGIVIGETIIRKIH
ncbi:MAG: adhesin [Flavobacteriaceae bacterium]|nr:MAG: adhesin [Flavobacteriaceae bacterium]